MPKATGQLQAEEAHWPRSKLWLHEAELAPRLRCRGICRWLYWQRRAASTPAEDPLCTEGEQKFILGNTVAPVSDI